jgi:zinc/manganese transport system substrate-binding protein
MVELSRADLVVAVGLELEVGWLPSLIAGARNPRIRPGQPGYLEAASAITPIEVASGADRSAGDVHRLGNPHFWLDPVNAGKIVSLIAARLSQLDPDGARQFSENAKRLRSSIDAAMVRWNEVMAPLKGTKVVSYHRTYDYFLLRFGLYLLGVVEDRPGIPPSPSHAAQLIRQMRDAGIRVVFHEQYHDRKTSDLIASKTSAKVLVLPTSVGGVPEASNYERLIDYLVSQFVAAAKGNP